MMLMLNTTQKRNRTKKRLLAFLVLACLLLGILPGSVFAAENAGEDDIVLDKWVEQSGENFKLVMESYVTGENGTVEQKHLPQDIVLVLDESGSMADILVHGCGGKNGTDVSVTPRGHLAQGVTINEDKLDEVLFVGHKVMADNVDLTKSYTIVYPRDGSTREIHYCGTCNAWYSDKNHNKHGGLAKWIPFQTENETPAEQNKGTDREWVCNVQFYERCGRTGKEVLQEAVSGFLHSLYVSSNPKTGADVHNRVAIVGYGQGASYISSDGQRKQVVENYQDIQNQYQFVASAENDAKNAFCDVANVESEQAFNTWVNGIHDTGSTPTQLGIQAAQLAFKNAPETKEQREKVMILFTDGAPGSGYINYGPGSQTGNPDWVTPGIQMAKEMKDDGVTIYSVGLFPSANGYEAQNISYDVKRDGQGTPGFFENANCFLHLVSSNYPAATGVQQTEWGTLSDKYKEETSQGDGHSYYLGTADGDELSKIFSSLSSVLTPGTTEVKLDEKAAVKDVVTNDFKIMYDEDRKANVTAYTMSYTGDDENGKKQWTKDEDSVSTVDNAEDQNKLHIKVGGQTVSVTNFDFAKNYVHKDGETAKGKKLVLEIEIAAADGTQGGARLATNTGTPGVYPPDSSTPVAEFPLPHVDLPTTVTVKKVVEGSDSTEEFPFEAAFSVDGSYENLSGTQDTDRKEGDSNYLHLKEVESKTETFDLTHDGEKKLEGVEVGYPLTISENTEDWHTTVTAETNTGEKEELKPETDGKYKVTVTPGMVVTFTNKAYTIEAQKVDKEDKPLSGAEFQLEKKNTLSPGGWDSIDEAKTTSSDGIATWSGLKAGQYRLKEVKAPEGYMKLSEYKEVAVPADGSNDTTVRVKIVNAKAPQTGGSGTLRYTAAGLIILGGATIALAILRRKNACR